MSKDEIALEVRGLTKWFGQGEAAVRAVEAVDLTARPGEVSLIMGPSGSGKTTLLTMIGGLLKPTSGSIRLFSQELTQLTEAELPRIRHRYIGFIFQSFNLLESLTAQQNVEVALNLAQVRGKAAQMRARELLTGVGLESRMKFHTKHLSGGERQRVSIARALANDAPLILADEPTANLDSRNGREVVGRLAEIAHMNAKCVIIVSHDARIRSIADHVYWLEDGRLVPDSDKPVHNAGGYKRRRLPLHNSGPLDSRRGQGGVP